MTKLLAHAWLGIKKFFLGTEAIAKEAFNYYDGPYSEKRPESSTPNPRRIVYPTRTRRQQASLLQKSKRTQSGGGYTKVYNSPKEQRRSADDDVLSSFAAGMIAGALSDIQTSSSKTKDIPDFQSGGGGDFGGGGASGAWSDGSGSSSNDIGSCGSDYSSSSSSGSDSSGSND